MKPGRRTEVSGEQDQAQFRPVSAEFIHLGLLASAVSSSAMKLVCFKVDSLNLRSDFTFSPVTFKDFSCLFK